MRQSLLIVDDELHMLRLLERILGERTPHDIVCTANSLEVPEILEGRRFDLIIADLKMPGLDGLDLLGWLRERDRDEELIMITAFGSMESAMNALSLGAFDYITKPFKKEQILYSVERAMRWQRVRRSSESYRSLLDLEPWERARDAFRRRYIVELVSRCDGDVGTAAERSGIVAQEIGTVMEEEGSQSSGEVA